MKVSTKPQGVQETLSDTIPSIPWGRIAAIVLGPLATILMIVTTPPEGLSSEGWSVMALAVWMGLWWMSEAMPLAVTSLLPVVIFPMFSIVPLAKATAPFASSIIYLFLGGFILSAAMQKWHLEKRFALKLLAMVGSRPSGLLAALMAVTCFMAMWVSNTATAIMMLPMALSVGALLSLRSDGTPWPLGTNPFTKALVMGIGFSAAIGGLGTFLGAPTNGILQAHLQKIYGYKLSLVDWMAFGVPVVVMIALLIWLFLSFCYMRGFRLRDDMQEVIGEELRKLGPMQRGEFMVSIIFFLAVGLWVFGAWLGIRCEDAVVSLLAALLLFLVPIRLRPLEFSMQWSDAERIPWGVLIFFGGTLSLSSALTETGVTTWLSTKLDVLQSVPLVLIVVLIVTMMVFVSEFMSNVATVTAFLPILSALAEGLEINPLLILVPATMAASCGFMMPGASAANALSYSTGHLRIRDLTRAGAVADLVSIVVITVATFTLISWSLGIVPGELPQWARF
jgi:sodium-dependent dicarboxylate transporter 2/3/5